MARQRLIWQLFPVYLIVMLGALTLLSIYTVQTVRGFFLEQITRDLESRAELLVHQFAPRMQIDSPEILDARCKELGQRANVRITLVSPTGEVIADSITSSDALENHANRPEISAALQGNTASSHRISSTVGEMMQYVAMPLEHDQKIHGAIRVALPVRFIEDTLQGMYLRMGIAGLLVALLAGVLSYGAVRRVIAPLEALKQGAQRFAQGELTNRLKVSEVQEFAAMAESMNAMASQLDERMVSVVRQSNELRALLGSMVESVLAVDHAGRILSINHAAARLLNIEPNRVRNQPISSVLRNPELLQFVGRALASTEPIESEINLHHLGEQKLLQAHGAVLADTDHTPIGAVVVLNDVSRMRRLEAVRRDFVANVSHELKTPITSIKGFVETLLDGAKDSPEDLERFLNIIARHADRLNNIIEDLLTLSSLDASQYEADGFLIGGSVAGVLRGATQLCSQNASAKHINLNIECPEDLRARMNPPLLEQGIVNLIDNAIKYSGEDSTVTISALQIENEVHIRVRDEGPGISSEHLPRLFERFYRVDKARSRGVGGTGLGLAIVKHIAQSHGGRVSVESQPGHGSTFTIALQSSDAAATTT